MGASVKSSLSALGGMKSSFVKNFKAVGRGVQQTREAELLAEHADHGAVGPIRSWIIELCRRSAHSEDGRQVQDEHHHDQDS